MMLTNESPKTICKLAALLVARKVGARVMIVTDSPRFIPTDYVNGEGRLLDRIQGFGFNTSFSLTDQTIRVKSNRSLISFVPLRCERDIERILGMEAEMVAVDERCLFTIPMLRQMMHADRTGFTMADLQALATIPQPTAA